LERRPPRHRCRSTWAWAQAASCTSSTRRSTALEWEEQDLYDGAARFETGFKAKLNAQNANRIDASFPISPVINVHQLGVIGNLVSPST
jgi:hypothetical protein